MSAIHQFDNGVKVYDHHLTPRQRKRYQQINIHEPREEELFVNIISSLGRGDCFVSVGSAIGYYPILARKINPAMPVHAFDPLKLHRQRFEENILLNDLRVEDFSIHEKAVAFADGLSTFLEQTFGSVVVDSFSLAGAVTYFKIIIKKMLTLMGIRHFQVGASTVQTVSLGTLIKIVDQPIGLLQMDIQGVEAAVLGGGTAALASHHIKNFLIGTHGARIHDECVDILRRSGYQIVIADKEVENQPDGLIHATLTGR